MTISNLLVTIYSAFGLTPGTEGSVAFLFGSQELDLDWRIDRYGEVYLDKEDTLDMGLGDSERCELVMAIEKEIAELEDAQEEEEEEELEVEAF